MSLTITTEFWFTTGALGWSLNRTNVELKRHLVLSTFHTVNGLNRTNVELKHIVGLYDCEWEVTFSSGKKGTFPTVGYISLEIVDDLDA